MSEIEVDCDASADTLCDRALEVVAKRGWLSKHSWSVSKAVHAFAKPIRVVLAAETPADVVQQLLLRSPIVAVQLEDNVVAPHPLPNDLHELILSESFSGSVAELPHTLHSFEAVGHSSNIAAIQSVLQRLPSALQRLHLSYLSARTFHGPRDWKVADRPALSTLTSLSLQGIEWSTSYPPCLHELCLTMCKVSGERQLPATLRKLQLVHCSSSSGTYNSMVVHLNAGLQQLVIASWCRVEFGSELPSTLIHVVLSECESSSSLREVLGAHTFELLHLELDPHLNEPLWVLPSTLQVLRLGGAHTQPLGVLPDTLTELDTGDRFNEALGMLPLSLKSLRIGSAFRHNLGPLPLHLEHLHLGKQSMHCTVVMPLQILALLLAASQHYLGQVHTCMQEFKAVHWFKLMIAY
jgi:hypothetical protein